MKRISRQEFNKRLILSSTGAGIKPRIAQGSMICLSDSDLDHVMKLLIEDDKEAAKPYFEQNRCIIVKSDFPVTIFKYPDSFYSGKVQFAFLGSSTKFWTLVTHIKLKQ